MSRVVRPYTCRWGQEGATGKFVFSCLCVGITLVLFSSPAAGTSPFSPAARLLAGTFASEHWELTARFDSGHVLFAQFLITNIGLGDRNAAASGHVVGPQGEHYRFRNGRREGRWTLSPDRLRMTVGASQLDLSRLPYRLQVEKEGLRLDLRFRPQRPVVWAGESAPAGYTLVLLDAAAPIEGTFWVKGMEQAVHLSGVAAFTHSWMNEAGSKLMLRRIEFFSLHSQCPVYAVEIMAPDGTRTQWTVAQSESTATYEHRALTVVPTDRGTAISDPRYPVPHALSLHAVGVEGQVGLHSFLLRDDPLGSLPRFFRLVVSLWLNLRPLRVWASSPFLLARRATGGAAEADRVPLQGIGVTAITFLNPVPFPAAEQLGWTAEGQPCASGC
ncbi:MAG: hypothetical protein NZ578_03300 [Candidatus Binatia bacterium]|nr:hypothetical protein [Candidatus Binatia bacterium]